MNCAMKQPLAPSQEIKLENLPSGESPFAGLMAASELRILGTAETPEWHSFPVFRYYFTSLELLP